MRITLQNYLNLTGVTIESVARKMGRSRETIRSWRDNPKMQSIVVYDATEDNIIEMEFSKRRVIKAKGE